MSEITETEKGFEVIGVLDNQSVPALSFQGRALMARMAQHAVSVDLSKVRYSDSSALALLLDWVRQAKIHQCKLTFLNPPKQLRQMANLYGIDDFIIFQDA